MNRKGINSGDGYRETLESQNDHETNPLTQAVIKTSKNTKRDDLISGTADEFFQKNSETKEALNSDAQPIQILLSYEGKKGISNAEGASKALERKGTINKDDKGKKVIQIYDSMPAESENLINQAQAGGKGSKNMNNEIKSVDGKNNVSHNLSIIEEREIGEYRPTLIETREEERLWIMKDILNRKQNIGRAEYVQYINIGIESETKETIKFEKRKFEVRRPGRRLFRRE